jgi:transitional endoplasmic reticulum ATPase
VSADAEQLARESRGLTGADLKAVVEDGKLLFAYDKANNKTLKPIEEYFLEAIRKVRANRRCYSRAKSSRTGEVTAMGFV